MSSVLIYWVLFVAILCVIGAWCTMVLMRRRNAFKLVVVKDWRNPSQGIKKYWLLWNDKKSKEYLVMYKTLWNPFRTSINPPFEMSAYVFDNTIYAYIGASGNPDEGTIVPIHIPIVSQPGAKEFYKEMSGAIIRTLNVADKTSGLDVGDVIDYDNADSGVKIKDGTIERIDFAGVTIAYRKPLAVDDIVNIERKSGTLKGVVTRRNKEMLEVVYTIMDENTKREVEQVKQYTDDDIERIERLNKTPSLGHWLVKGDEDMSKIQIVKRMHKPDEKAEQARVNKMIRLFSPKWVMDNLGVVPVEDVNVVLENTKNAVQSFNSKLHNKAQAHKSFWGQHPELIIVIAGIIILGIFTTIVWNAAGGFLNNIGNRGVAIEQNFALALLNQTRGVHTGTTSVVTTIAPVTTINGTPA